MARMGGKLINYYSQDLTQLLLDDILKEVAIDLQNCEKKQKRRKEANQGQKLAQDLLGHLVDYQNSNYALQQKYIYEEDIQEVQIPPSKGGVINFESDQPEAIGMSPNKRIIFGE